MHLAFLLSHAIRAFRPEEFGSAERTIRFDDRRGFYSRFILYMVILQAERGIITAPAWSKPADAAPDSAAHMLPSAKGRYRCPRVGVASNDSGAMIRRKGAGSVLTLFNRKLRETAFDVRSSSLSNSLCRVLIHGRKLFVPYTHPDGAYRAVR